MMASSRRPPASSIARAFAFTSSTSTSDESIREANETLNEAFGTSASTSTTTPASVSTPSTSGSFATLTHVDARTGKATMVNVGAKATTAREAVASARVYLGADAFALVRDDGVKKGDVLAVARLAGIMGAKRTHDLIPLCHAVALDSVSVDLTLAKDEHAIDIRATAHCSGKTGVEMEALTAAAVTGLTIYDMCKAVSKDIVIGDVRLEKKTGGKSGAWSRALS